MDPFILTQAELEFEDVKVKPASEMTEEELRLALASEGCYDPEWYREE